MKRFKLFLVLALLIGASFIAVSPAFALTCKTGNYGSDECWTTAQLTTNDAAVIAGTVMVYDFTSVGQDADGAAFKVRAASSNDQGYIVAGVAQRTYSSSDRVELLVRGQGKIRSAVALSSGDRIYVLGPAAAGSATKGIATNVAALPNNGGAAGVTVDKVIAFSLKQTAAAATTDAYITVI